MTDSAPLAHYPDLGDRVYYLIREQILTGKLPPGSLLLGVELARDMGVSRTPVADALNVLAAEGLVEVSPRKGYFVATLDTQAYLDLMDARLAIELAAVERGITRANDSQRAAIRQQLALVNECRDEERHGDDYQEWLRRDAEFHELLVGSAGNPYLTEVYRRLSARVHLAHIRFSLNAGLRPSQHAMREHEAILAAFESGDLAALKAAIGEHSDRSVQFYAASRPEETAPQPVEQGTFATRAAKRLRWPGRNRLAEQH